MAETPSTPSFCVECGAGLPDGAKFCPQCGTKVAAPVEPAAGPAEVAPPAADGPATTSLPVPDVPPELRERYEAARAALRGDRREVAVLFADVQGYTSLAESMDPEEIGMVMQGLLSEMAQAVHRWGGYVDKYIGDAIMALFGAPVAHEDDAARAVEAALAMQAAVERRRAEDGPGLSLRVGVNVGEVVAGHVGAESRSQYTVMGDAVNVASRLENAAEPGTVLVSDAVWRRVSRRFEAEETPPLSLKGKSETVRAHRVTGRRTAVTGPAAATPFVGRERELSEVAEWLDGVAGTGAPPIVIEGGAGAGKSRLAAEALSSRDDGFARIDVAFAEVRPPGARSPAAEAFRQVAGEGADAAERALARLGEGAADHRAGALDLAREAEPGAARPRPDVDPEAARRNRWLALAAILRAIAAERPLVVVAEDLHWADESDADWVAFLADALEGSPAGLLLTGRPPVERAPGAARRVALDPLADDAARRMVDALVAELPVETRADLARRGQGNPLFLEELARAASEGGEVPGTLQGIVRSRIDRLEPAAQRLLQMAAVLGLRFPDRLLARMHALEEDAPAYGPTVGALEEAGFLEVPDDGERRFRHALEQEIAHRGILHRVSRVLHESAARIGSEVFDDPDAEPAFFAHHFWRADRKAEAAPWLWAAGRAAWEAFDLAAADRWLSRAAEAVEAHPDAIDPPERARLHEIAGAVAFHRGAGDAATESAAALKALGEDAGEGAWVARGLEIEGRVAWNRGRLDEALDAFEAGLDRLDEDAGKVAADLHNDLGVVHYYRGEPAKARDHYERALAIREADDDPAGMAKVLSNLGNVYVDLDDDLEKAASIYRRALELADRAGDRRLLCSATLNLGRAVLERGDFEESIDRMTRSRALAEEIGWPYARLVAMLNHAQALVFLGRIAEAIPIFAEIRRESDTASEAVGRFNARAYPVEMWLRANAIERAEASLEEARAIAEEEGLDEIADDVAVLEGRVAAARGEWEEALAAFARAAEAAAEVEHEAVGRLARAHRGRAAARAGLPDPGSPPAYEGARRPVAALLDYLAADGAAARSPDRAAADALLAAGEAAAELDDPGLERAGFERAAEVLEALGEADRAAEARGRAAAAARRIADGLPSDLAEAFVASPRNSDLLEGSR